MKEVSYSYEPHGAYSVGDEKKFSDGVFVCVKVERGKHDDKCYWERIER